MRLFIPTCDKYLQGVEALLITLTKYWKDQTIVILGYNSPQFNLPENVTFHSMGTDRGTKEWSSDLRKYFENIQDEFFIYINDDTLILDNVDTNIISELIKELRPEVGRVSLTGCVANRPYSILKKRTDYDLIQSSQRADYRISTQYSIWNREYFLKYLTPGLTPWEFELQQSELAKNDQAVILGTLRKFPIEFSHLYKRGRLIESWYKSVHTNKVLAEEIKEQISNILWNRSIQK